MAGWIQHDRTGDVVEIVIRDCSGRLLDRFRFNGKDSKIYGKVLRILRDVYDFLPDNFNSEIKDDSNGKLEHQKEKDLNLI